MEKNVEISILLDLYGPLLTDTQRQAISEHYDEDQSFSEIGQRLDKTRQAVHDAVSKGVSSLYEFEEKLGMMKRYLTFEEEIAVLQEIAEIQDASTWMKLKESIDKLRALWEENDGV